MKQTVKMRLVYALCAAGFIVLGLGSRFWRDNLPALVAEYAGDTLWASMTYCAVGFLFPRWRILQKFLLALAIAWGVEISQLYHVAWIDQIRANWFAHLILGDTFVWSDIVCYAIGALGGGVFEWAVVERLRKFGD